MTAGEALKRDHVAGYNCAYVSAGRVRSFDEILYILMCGTGVGFSVERDFLGKLATIAEEFEDSDTTIVVQDSKLGWAKAYKELTSLLISGQIPQWDVSKVRPAGERLKTFGGRSSGPEPLDDLFKFQWIPIRRLVEENSPLSNAMISSVRLRKLSLSGEYEEVPSSRYRLLQMNECGKQRLVSGGTKTHNEHCQTTQ